MSSKGVMIITLICLFVVLSIGLCLFTPMIPNNGAKELMTSLELLDVLPFLSLVVTITICLLLLYEYYKFIQQVNSYCASQSPDDLPPPYEKFKIDAFLQDPPTYEEAVKQQLTIV